jgi:hypothetical protein
LEIFLIIFKTRLNFFQVIYLERNRDSVVGIAATYMLDDRGVEVLVPVGSIIFSSPDRPDLESSQPPTQWEPGDFPRW